MPINDAFAYHVALEIIYDDEVEPRSVTECQRRADWPKWKEAIQAELDSLAKRQVFGPVVPTPPNVINGSLSESEMRKVKSSVIKLDLWRKAFLNALELTMRRHTLQLWISSPSGI